MGEALFFYVFAVLTIIGSIVVVSHKNPVASAISMVLTFFFTAVLFILLRAQFIAAIQVLVYAGAIIVLFLFTVMFLNIKEDALQFDSKNITKKITFLIIIIAVAGYFASRLTVNMIPATGVSENFGTVESVGRVLFTEYLLPFELTSILIVAAIIGVVSIAKRSQNS
ncbi:MAG: NADH-quinone oxidoreductase subunit J [Thermodesulfobacteriota bacterium]